MEIWKAHPLNIRYSVSNYGNVVKHSKHGDTILSGYLSGKGYLRVHIGGKQMQIHVLVSSLFIPNPLGLKQVNHKDTDKLNNHVSNLEWVTPSSNIIHALVNNRMAGGQKLTYQSACEIKRRLDSGSDKFGLALDYGVSVSSINKIKKGIQWKFATCCTL